jgi:hypothetical protein
MREHARARASGRLGATALAIRTISSIRRRGAPVADSSGGTDIDVDNLSYKPVVGGYAF